MVDQHKNIRHLVFVWMLKNKSVVVKIKFKYIDSTFILTIQVSAPHNLIGVYHISCNDLALTFQINNFYPCINCFPTYSSQTVKCNIDSNTRGGSM